MIEQDIILAGVGGQGILTLAAILTRAAMDTGLSVRQSEIHGMAQRGGPVNCHLRLSSDALHSPLISLKQADLILGVEPMEALRYAPWLKNDGWIVANEEPVLNIPDYPNLQSVLDRLRAHPNHILLHARNVAASCGSLRSANIVMLGAAAPVLALDSEAIVHAIKSRFESKGATVIDSAVKAFHEGQTVTGKLA